MLTIKTLTISALLAGFSLVSMAQTAAGTAPQQPMPQPAVVKTPAPTQAKSDAVPKKTKKAKAVKAKKAKRLKAKKAAAN